MVVALGSTINGTRLNAVSGYRRVGGLYNITLKKLFKTF